MKPEQLSRPKLFEPLSLAQREALAAIAEEVTRARGEVVFEEDARGDGLWLLTEGAVQIELSLLPGHEPEIIAHVKVDEVFGEMALLDGHRRSATARAAAPSTLQRFRREALDELMQADAELGFQLMRGLSRVLAGRLRETNMSLRATLQQQRTILRALH